MPKPVSASSSPNGAPLQPPRAQRTVAVIPARLASTRLSRKVLREIAGEPLLAWVYAAAQACSLFDQVLIAAESAEVEALCKARGWPFRMTSPALQSGSDRLFAVARQVEADIYVNIQGDEPLLQAAHFEALLRPFREPAVQVTTLKTPCPAESITNPNVVKVVTDVDGRALYFSRSTIPFDRDGSRPDGLYWKHIGLYAYRAETLARFAALPLGTLEQIEKLEQLRLLENGIPIHVAEVTEDTLGVDTEEDLQRVEALLLAKHRSQDEQFRAPKG